MVRGWGSFGVRQRHPDLVEEKVRNFGQDGDCGHQKCWDDGDGGGGWRCSWDEGRLGMSMQGRDAGWWIWQNKTCKKRVTADKDSSVEGGEYAGKFTQQKICGIEAGQWEQKRDSWWWRRRIISMTEEKRDNEYDGSIKTRGKVQAYWVGKNQQCPTQWKNNGGSNGSVSVSQEGEAKKEAALPAYQTRDCGSSNGILNGVP